MDYDIELFGGKLVIDNILDSAIQELDILFGTEETELLGDYKFGTNFEQFLWKLQPSIEDINNYIYGKISDYTVFCKLLKITVNTKILAGTLRDIYQVEIHLYDNSGNSIKVKNYLYQ